MVWYGQDGMVKMVALWMLPGLTLPHQVVCVPYIEQPDPSFRIDLTYFDPNLHRYRLN